jgi:hypothetical protein
MNFVKMIKKIRGPPNFRVIKRCATCIYCIELNTFLHCTKYNCQAYGLTVCDNWEEAKE